MKRFASLVVVALATAFLAGQSFGQSTNYVPLEIFTNGPGVITPLQGGQQLEVWQTYSMEAVPASGFAFYNWEWVDVFIQATRATNDLGQVVTNVQKTVTSKSQFYPGPDLVFIVHPVTVQQVNDQLTTIAGYGWRANFGPVLEPVEPNYYRTATGAVAQERGDAVPGGSRVVPISATVGFDFTTDPPSLTTEIPNAVLEGGAPFPLTVRSYYGQTLSNGTYQFTGDYLQDIHPSGSQYLFDWKFSALTNGDLVWTGIAGWTGGHYWQFTVSNLTLVPLARLSISRPAPASFQLSWATNVPDYLLECATNFPATAWIPVTDPPTANGKRITLTVQTNAAPRFYRLHKL